MMGSIGICEGIRVFALTFLAYYRNLGCIGNLLSMVHLTLR
jgi:hypothetical protein